MMQLYGAMAYRDCTKAVLATDRECMADAVEVANKLGIEILYLNGNEDARQMNADKEPVCVENLQVRTILPSVICGRSSLCLWLENINRRRQDGIRTIAETRLRRAVGHQSVCKQVFVWNRPIALASSVYRHKEESYNTFYKRDK